MSSGKELNGMLSGKSRLRERERGRESEREGRNRSWANAAVHRTRTVLGVLMKVCRLGVGLV